MANSKTMTIASYKPFWIYVGSVWKNTKTEYGMIAKTSPFPLLPQPKDVYTNDWPDEDGVEEYVGAIKYNPIDFDVEFFVREEGSTAAASIQADLESFFTAVKSSDFKIYDDFNGRGYQNVRYMGLSKESLSSSTSSATAIVTVSFRANDPITSVTMGNQQVNTTE